MRTSACSSSNRNSASARASSVLPTPVGPMNRNEPIGRSRVAEPRARAAHGVRDQQQRLVLADHALAQAVLDVQQLLDLALEHPRDRDAGPLRDHLGDVLGVDLLLEHRCFWPGSCRRASLVLAASCLLELGQRAVAQLGRLAEVARAASACLGLEARLLDLLLEPRGSSDRLPSPAASAPSSPASCSLQVGELLLDLLRGARARPCPSPSAAPGARSRAARCFRSTSSISVGSESISMRRRLAASSIRSIALSGRKRSAM